MRQATALTMLRTNGIKPLSTATALIIHFHKSKKHVGVVCFELVFGDWSKLPGIQWIRERVSESKSLSVKIFGPLWKKKKFYAFLLLCVDISLYCVQPDG